MFRTGPQVSAQNKDKQKQKKKLSFREPEIEVPKKPGNLLAGSRQNQVARPSTTGKELVPRRTGPSEEHLSLEDQALQIAQSVGQAFSKQVVQSQNSQQGCLPKISHFNSLTNSHQEQGEPHKGGDRCVENASYHRSCQLRNFKITVEDQNFLDAISPTLHESTMRCPSIEADAKVTNSIPASQLDLEKFPRGAQHQIQILKYQLDQQGQQTQSALHQVLLLKDQLEAESTARYKAQTQNHQLMLQNKELLDHIERLFQQIEDLEKHVETLEQDKRPSKIPFLQEPQAPNKWSGSYGGRRLSSDETMYQEKVTTPGRSQIATNRRGSLTSTTKPTAPQTKTAQVQSTTNRRGSITSRPYSTVHHRPDDKANKPTDTALRIGDTSPPVQKTTSSPFSGGWKSKVQETSNQTLTERSATRTRNNSFSSGAKSKTPDSTNSFYGSASSVSSSGVVPNRRYSGSTSDLYNNGSGAYQVSTKPLKIDESTIGNDRSTISNVSVNATSKLPRFQPYSGWQRNNSMVNDCDQLGGIGREAFKNAPETSLLFNK